MSLLSPKHEAGGHLLPLTGEGRLGGDPVWTHVAGLTRDDAHTPGPDCPPWQSGPARDLGTGTSANGCTST